MRRLSVSICLFAVVIGSTFFLFSCGGGHSTSPRTVPPSFSTSASTLTFDKQLINTSSAASTVTISNTGGSNLVITGVSVAGANASDFKLSSPTLPITVLANTTLSLQVTFAPQARGSRTASLSFADNAAGSPHTVTLNGTAVAPVLSGPSAPVEYGAHFVSSAATTKTVVLSNTGDGDLNVTAVTIGGDNATDFQFRGLQAFTVPPGTTAPIDLLFKPTAAGKRTAQVAFTDNSSTGTHVVVSLEGAGITDGPAQPDNASVVVLPNAPSSPEKYPATIDVELTGTNTKFASGATAANFGPGIAVSDGTSAGLAGEFGPVQVTSETHAIAHLTLDGMAASGRRMVTVVSGGHESIATFVVPDGTPGPIAHAEPAGRASVGKDVYLDGSTSVLPGTATVSAARTNETPSGNGSLSFHWELLTVPDGSQATLSNPDSVKPSLVPDKDGTYTAQLIVSDGAASTANWVVLSTGNASPVARAGNNQFVQTGVMVKLNASASVDRDGDKLSYWWSLLAAPDGSAASLSDSTAVTPTFTADAAGDYLFLLTVDDGHGNTSSDTTLVSTEQSHPIADAGAPHRVNVGETAELDGSASKDPDGDAITCTWSLVSQPAGSTAQLSNSTPVGCDVKPTFTVDQSGTYVAQLLVTDAHANAAVATTVVTSDEATPIADAGKPQTVTVGDTVELDGSKSTDDGNALDYSWAILAQPSSSTAALSQSTSVNPVFVPDVAGDYVVQLIVSDATFPSVPATVLITAAAPAVSVSPSALAFDTQTVNTSSDSHTVTITNSGEGKLTIANIGITGANGNDFAFTSAALPISVPAGATTEVNVVFTPSAAVSEAATLTITHNAGGGSTQVALSGTGAVPALELTPTAINFSNQLVGQPSEAQPITVKNTGNGVLNVTNVAVTGPQGSEFAVTPTSLSVNPGQSGTVNVTFTPTDQGARSATLTLSDNAAGSPHSISLTGNATAPGFSADVSSLGFGNQLIATASTAKSVTITNTGTAPLHLSAPTLSGTNASDFSITNGAADVVVQPNATVTIAVTFKPAAMGDKSATLTIASDARSPYAVTLSGTGIAPKIQTDVTSLAFPDSLVGNSSSAQTVTVTNSGTAPLHLNAAVLSNTADFVGDTVPTTAIDPGNFITVHVTFKPSVGGDRTGTLTFTSDAANGPAVVTLSGKGLAPGISVNKTTVDFGNQLLRQSSEATITVTNTGNSDLTISALTFGGANPTDFSTSTSTPFTIAANQPKTINITFTPSELLARSATLTIENNATAQVISLTGTGTRPGISAPDLAFGNQTVGVTSAATPLAITNSGTAPLHITALTISANTAEFAVTTPAPLTIDPGKTANVNLTFNPSQMGNRAGALTITSDAPTSPTTIQLSGMGTEAVLSAAPEPLSFGSLLITKTSTASSITISNSGNIALSITGLGFGGTHASDFAFAAGFTAPTAGSPLTVAPDTFITIPVVFAPTAVGTRSATLDITDNSTGSPHHVGVTGVGTAPGTPTFSPNPVTLNQIVGTTSAVVPVTVTNPVSASGELLITAVTIQGANAADFATTTTASSEHPISVTPGNSTTINITLTPAAVGTRNATLMIVDNAAGGQHSVPLNGTGSVSMVNAASLTFTQVIGSTSDPQPVTISYPAGATGSLAVSSVAVSGTNASEFTVTHPALPAPLTSTQSQGISVTFTPAAAGGAGARSATLTITDSTGKTSPVTLSGTAQAAALTAPASLSFGNPLVNDSATAVLTMTNPGNLPLHVAGFAITGANAADFSIPPTSGIDIPALQSATVILTFRPAAEGLRTATLNISDNGLGNPHTVTLTGSGTTPGSPTFNPNPVNLVQVVGTPSAVVPVTVTNPATASGPLLITAIAIQGTNAGDYATTTTASAQNPISIDPGTSKFINVTFTPTAAGVRSAQLVITDNAAGGQHAVTLNGNGATSNLTPASLSFADQVVGTTSAAESVTMSYPAGASGTLALNSVALSGQNAAEFAISHASLPALLSSTQNQGIGVTFSPAAAGGPGSRSATLTASDTTGKVYQIPLSGTALAAQLSVPASLDFGSRLVNGSVTKELLVSNTGNLTLHISGFAISGANASEFSIPPTNGIDIPAGQAATVSLVFTPTAVGTRSATLDITDSSSGSPHHVALTGAGTAPGAPTFSPNPVTFNQIVGTTSPVVPVTVTNPASASGELLISAIAIQGANAGEFASTTTASSEHPISLAPGNSTLINVMFTPAAPGARTATLVIVDNAAGGQHSVDMNGTGSVSAVNPTTLTFAGQVVGTTSSAQPVTISYPAGATGSLAVSSVAVAGTNASEFTVTHPAFPATLTSTQSQVISVTFAPAAAGGGGARTATLTIADSTGKTSQITLSGTALAPGMDVPASLSFGSQLANTTSAAVPLIIANNGTATLHVSAFAITGTNASEFSIPPTNGFDIPAGQSATVNLTFRPAAVGPRTATLSINDNALGSPHAVALTGTGVASDVSVQPTSLSFGNQTVNTASSPMSVQVTNSGTATLHVTAISFTGANGSDFSTTTPPFSLEPNAATNISVTFKPSTASAESAALVLSDDTPAGSHQVALSGTGVVPSISIAPAGGIDFGNQRVSTSSASQAVTITNDGLGTLLISGVNITGTNSADYAFAPGFNPPSPANQLSLASGANVQVPLVFTPAGSGSRSASLQINSNTTQTTVNLAGTGTAPLVTFTPASTLAFGDQLLNTASGTSLVTITNSGTADLKISGIQLSGTNAADFALVNAPAYPATVTAGGSLQIGVVFTPRSLNPESATLSVTDDAAGSPHTLALTGTGVAPSILPLAPVAFGNVNVGSTSTSTNVTVTNPGSAPLHITAVNFGGANAGDFSTTTTFPLTVAKNNGTATIALQFSPQAPGARAGTLLLTDDATGSPHSAALSGTGVAVPIFGVTPTTLDFGSVNIGVTSASQSLTISNTGTADLVVNHLVKSGANAADFLYTVLGTQGSSDFPETLVPGSTLTVKVSFQPGGTEGGTRTATMRFQDPAGTTLGSVSVSGIAVPPAPTISLSTTSLAFPGTPTNTNSAPMSVQVTNNGTKDLTISALGVTGTNASDFTVTTSVPITVTKGGGTANINVVFKPGATGSRSAQLAITNDAGNTVHVDTVSLSGTGYDLGRLNLQPTSVGANLEVLAIGSVDVAPTAPLSITISSSDPTKLLLSPLATDSSGTNLGVASFVGTLPAGKGLYGSGFPAFWVQSLASSGSAQIIMTAPGYTASATTVTLTPSGFVLSSPNGPGVSFNTQLNGSNTNLTVGVVQLDSAGTILANDQRLRGGQNTSVTVNSATPSVGSIVGTPVAMQGGSLTSLAGALQFHPLAVGTTVLNITPPAGFSAPTSGSQITATVNTPAINLTPAVVGYNLQVIGGGALTVGAPIGGVQVTIVSSDPTKALLTTNPALAGTGSVSLTVPAGMTQLPTFYIQSLASSGTVTLTATAPGYSSGTTNVLLAPSGFLVRTPDGANTLNTTTLSSVSTLNVAVWQLSSTLTPLTQGQIRGGYSISVPATSSSGDAGTLSGSPVAFHSGDSSQSGLFFQPNRTCNAPCTTVVSAMQPSGFSAPASGGQVAITVNIPKITIRVPQPTIGKNLEVIGSGALDVPAPTDLQVTISSDNSAVLLSPSPSAAGGPSVTLTVFQGNGVNSLGFPAYYIQSLSDTGTAQLTISAPGFLQSTFSVSLAPSGFVIEGPNGVGVNFGTVLANGNLSLNIRAALLDRASGAPLTVYESVRGGLSATVDVTSSVPGVASIAGAPLQVSGGSAGGVVVFQPQAPGQTTLNIGTPLGFTTPASGYRLVATVN